MSHKALTFLPGKFRLTRGSWADYRTLARFHYRPKHPRNHTQIWTVWYRVPDAEPQVVAVGVVSYPHRFTVCRHRAIGMHGGLGNELRFINRHIRTISRVIVHPQFRSLGLSKLLVRWICKHCDTRYTEAVARMGRAHPFFERAGMKRYEPPDPDASIYYLYRKRPGPARVKFNNTLFCTKGDSYDRHQRNSSQDQEDRASDQAPAASHAQSL